MINTQTKRYQRARRVRNRLKSVTTRLRLSVFRSHKHFWAQIIDDSRGVTLVSASTKNLQKFSGTKTEAAARVGQLLAKRALASKIKQVYLDRGPYRYHGRVKAFAQAARQQGLEF